VSVSVTDTSVTDSPGERPTLDTPSGPLLSGCESASFTDNSDAHRPQRVTRHQILSKYNEPFN